MELIFICGYDFSFKFASKNKKILVQTAFCFKESSHGWKSDVLPKGGERLGRGAASQADSQGSAG